MSHFTSKLALGKPDHVVHQKLVKFSKGNFDGPVIEVNAKGKTLIMNGSAEYEDIIGWIMASLAPPQLELKITGSIKSNEDESETLRSLGLDLRMKKPKGKSRYEVKIGEKTLVAEKLKDLYSSLMEESIILLTVKPIPGGKEWSMSTKKSYPRPAMKGDLKGPDTDFCKAVIPVSEEAIKTVLSEVAPDFADVVERSFKQLRVVNLYQISDVILPENEQNLDFAEVRTKAKRKGLLIRKVSVDGKEFTKEVEFCA
jgi:hypothetical protein